MFAVVLTGAPGSGKTVCLTALSDAGHDVLLVSEEAAPATLRERIAAREPPGWSGLDFLLDYTQRTLASLARLDDVHLVLDSESLTPAQITDRIRFTRPDKLSRGPANV